MTYQRSPQLAAFERYPQWILWQAVPRPDGRTDKRPIDWRTGRTHDAHDPAIWMTADAAYTRAAASALGVGFVFTDTDPFFFIDVDNCADPDRDSGWNETADTLRQWLPTAAWEVSQSGRGLHAFGVATLPPDHPIKCDGFDCYTRRRFVALTGAMLPDSGTADTPAPLLPAMLAQYPSTHAAPAPDAPYPPRRADWSGPSDDGELLMRMLNSRSASAAFNSGATIHDLISANADALARAYPDDHGDRPYDESAADMALFSHLAWWTGGDAERMERMARTCTALVRDKWDREDYMRRTVSAACARLTSCYREPAIAPPPPPGAPAPDAPRRVFLGPAHQAELFKGCCYISDIHAIWIPDGRVLKPDQFKVEFGGYTFALGTGEGAKTTDDAWKAYTLNQDIRFPRAATSCFEPAHLPGEMVGDEINTWRPRFGVRATGDPTPFLDYVKRIVPCEFDRRVLLDYMAACVQHAGYKFQWCVVLCGVEGNGKSFLFDIMTGAIGRQYARVVQGHDLDSKFNSWLDRSLVAHIPDLRAGKRHDVAEVLKPIITDRICAVQAKGQDVRTIKQCCNLFITSNHDDAVLVTANDRRYAVIHTAQTAEADCIRDGLTGTYWRDLRMWVDRGGQEVINEYLWSREIETDMFGRAPDTGGRAVAKASTMGSVEQEIMEMADCDGYGFADGVIDARAARGIVSVAVGRRLSPEAFAKALHRCGYVRHPATDATQGKIKINPGRIARPWVKIGHPLESIRTLQDLRSALPSTF
jgi:hypothetical protein